jgi:hypothetical protein
MNATTRLRLAAPLDLQDCGNDLWCLRGHTACGTRVYLRGFVPPAALSGCAAVSLEWPAAGGSLLTVESPAGTVAVRAAGAFVHTFPEGLYTALPLARFDARGMRFWRRVFLLVRLPGARWILQRIAANSR